MAWDALANRFQKQQRTEEDKGLASEAYSAAGGPSGGAPGGGFSPQANPTGGFGGTAGSSAGPVSAGFVNYGTLYGANEEKAKKMASGLYKGAESKAEGARGALDAAQNQFKDKAATGAGNWRPIGGAHGTEVRWNQPQQTKPPAKDTVKGSVSPGGRDVSGGHGLDVNIQSFQPSTGGITIGDNLQTAVTAGERSSAAPGAVNAGASRYDDLFGPTSGALQKQTSDEDLRGYNHSVSELEAKSGAGQDYTGPDSLKDSMGDEAYAALVKQYADAQNAVKGLGDAGGIAEALGYAGNNSGNAAMDAGLTQTAGQSNFKRLADRYSGLGKEVATAQTNSLADVGRADAASDVAADVWQSIIDEYEAEKKKGADDGAIRIGSVNEVAGKNAGTDPLTNPGPGWDELGAAGYSQQEISDIYDSLSDDEKMMFGLTTDQRATTSGLSGGDGATIWQGILKKLDEARAKKRGE